MGAVGAVEAAATRRGVIRVGDTVRTPAGRLGRVEEIITRPAGLLIRVRTGDAVGHETFRAD